MLIRAACLNKESLLAYLDNKIRLNLCQKVYPHRFLNDKESFVRKLNRGRKRELDCHNATCFIFLRNLTVFVERQQYKIIAEGLSAFIICCTGPTLVQYILLNLTNAIAADGP
jgi:hypothetical protein